MQFDSSKQSLASLVDSLLMTPQAEAYLDSRGLTDQAVSMFRLGVVPGGTPAEWQRFVGMLGIPYLTVSGAVAIKFRRLDGGEPKYDGPRGQKTGLFNAIACMDDSDRIVVTEGEIDAITLHAQCGVPAVGVPGATNWKKHYRRCIDGFSDVVILTDNDEAPDRTTNPGQDLALKVKDQIPSARIVELPAGFDVNEFFVNHGRDAVLELIA